MAKTTFTRKEVAFLIDALLLVQGLDPSLRKERGMSNERLRVMLFKLWRVLNSG